MNESGLWKPLELSYSTTREHLHQLAFYAVSPARYDVEEKMGLRATPGGFGTPEFAGRVARVEGDLLVHEQSGNVATRTVTTIREAAEFFGREYAGVWYEGFHDPPAPMDPDRNLEVVDTDARLIGDWFAFGFDVLELFRSRVDGASAPQLWPEHFDAAIEAGDADRGRRASYGFSPGDHDHPEPYAYVAAWGDIDRSDQYWNDVAFNGSSLSYEELTSEGNPAAASISFFMDAYHRLQESPGP